MFKNIIVFLVLLTSHVFVDAVYGVPGALFKTTLGACAQWPIALDTLFHKEDPTYHRYHVVATEYYYIPLQGMKIYVSYHPYDSQEWYKAETVEEKNRILREKFSGRGQFIYNGRFVSSQKFVVKNFRKSVYEDRLRDYPDFPR